jgi:MFS family permease
MLSGSEAFGWGLGGLVAGILADTIGIREGFAWLVFLPLISMAFVAWKLPEAEVETPQTDKPQTRPQFPKKLFYLYGTVFIRMSSAIALWSLMPIYLQQFVKELTWVGAITAANMLIQPLFMVLIGKHAERLGRLRLVIWGIIGTVVTFWLYGSAPNLIPILIGQATISLSWAAIMIGMNTYIMTTAPQGTRGKAFGYLTGSITSAMAIGPLLGTSLADAFSIRGMIFIVSMLMLFSLPFVIYLRMKDQLANQSQL